MGKVLFTHSCTRPRTFAIQRNHSCRYFSGGSFRGLQLVSVFPVSTQSSNGSGEVESVPHSPFPKHSIVFKKKGESMPTLWTVIPLLAGRELDLENKESTRDDVLPYGSLKPRLLMKRGFITKTTEINK